MRPIFIPARQVPERYSSLVKISALERMSIVSNSSGPFNSPSSLDLFVVALGSVIGVLMNGTILSQIIVYQKPTPQKGKKKD
ncbi:hypothetical protein MTR67_050451 [Solanum verrucosum]|uniref:Uncharacterized protein n=1 Tax=Solanum verrucosum TaxID=315347 RepID=A0AAF0V5A6_SOLVR|nr:hypothetical protein MTR67_050451 [Solanum verrucosum]